MSHRTTAAVHRSRTATPSQHAPSSGGHKVAAVLSRKTVTDSKDDDGSQANNIKTTNNNGPFRQREAVGLIIITLRKNMTFEIWHSKGVNWAEVSFYIIMCSDRPIGMLEYFLIRVPIEQTKVLNVPHRFANLVENIKVRFQYIPMF